MNEEKNKQRQRISKSELRRLSRLLDSREISIIEHIHRVKFATSDQLRRVFFTEHKNEVASLRACNRATNRLKQLGLIDHLEDNIGGKRGGSSGRVWTFTGAAYNLLKMGDTTLKPTRKRLYQPSSILFLEHTLSVNEAYTRLLELDRQKRIGLLEIQHEPRCWRTFQFNKIDTFLKPDLFVSLALNEYVDTYFLELDRDTEAPSKVIKKCKQYIIYYNSGIEQRQDDNGVHGIFPYVVWITPNEKRREQLIRYIRKELPKAEMLFRVITMEEFETLIAGDNTKEED